MIVRCGNESIVSPISTPSQQPKVLNPSVQYSVTPEDVKDDSERKTSTYLKAAGNLATRKAVRSLARFISAEGDQPIRRRMSAIWSLLRAAPKHPELVRITPSET